MRVGRRSPAMGVRVATLAVAFALHNAEELARFDAWDALSGFAPPADRATFPRAVALLTGLVALALGLAAARGLRGGWGWVAGIIAGGLLVNAAGHVGLSLWTAQALPGVVTVLVMGPAAAWLIAGLELSGRAQLAALALGGAVMPAVALAALGLARVTGGLG